MKRVCFVFAGGVRIVFAEVAGKVGVEVSDPGCAVNVGAVGIGPVGSFPVYVPAAEC